MLLAIHKRKGSFSDRWIEYCEINNIPFRIVDCYDLDILDVVKDCDGIMWHWDQNDYKAKLIARQLTVVFERMGKSVFPNSQTGFHFDDKVVQKYLFDALLIPAVPARIYYSKSKAINSLKEMDFPLVFKLRGGAGSENVRLVQSVTEAKRIIKKAFSNGFNSINKRRRFVKKFLKFIDEPSILSFRNVLSATLRFFLRSEIDQLSIREKGYVYFQNFIKENTYDTRLVIVGHRCFGLRRYCNNGDFRASGSGKVSHDKRLIDPEMVKVAFKAAKSLNMQSVAFDFVWHEGKPLIIEVSYCYAMGRVYDECQGYWNEDLTWFDEKINPQIFIIEDFLKTIG